MPNNVINNLGSFHNSGMPTEWIAASREVEQVSIGVPPPPGIITTASCRRSGIFCETARCAIGTKSIFPRDASAADLLASSRWQQRQFILSGETVGNNSRQAGCKNSGSIVSKHPLRAKTDLFFPVAVEKTQDHFKDDQRN